MKIHMGHISNSSSSSFIVSGRTTGAVMAALEGMLDLHNALSGEEPVGFGDAFGGVYNIDASVKARLSERCRNYRYTPGGGEWNGGVLIDSAGDNSIPPVISDMIEEYLDATRYHWGGKNEN